MSEKSENNGEKMKKEGLRKVVKQVDIWKRGKQGEFKTPNIPLAYHIFNFLFSNKLEFNYKEKTVQIKRQYSQVGVPMAYCYITMKNKDVWRFATQDAGHKPKINRFWSDLVELTSERHQNIWELNHKLMWIARRGPDDQKYEWLGLAWGFKDLPPRICQFTGYNKFVVMDYSHLIGKQPKKEEKENVSKVEQIDQASFEADMCPDDGYECEKGE